MKTRIQSSLIGLIFLSACATTSPTPPRMTTTASVEPVAETVVEPLASAPNAAVTTTALLANATPVTVEPASVQGGDPGYRGVQLYLGPRSFDTTAQNLISLGIEYASESPDNLVGYEVAFFYSPEDDIAGGTPSVEGSSWELAVGARRTFFRDSELMPYFGAGLNYVNFEVTPGTDDGTAGIYAHFGMLAKLGETMRLGVEYRVSQSWTEIDLGADVGLNYDTLNIVLGFSF